MLFIPEVFAVNDLNPMAVLLLAVVLLAKVL
jgi:hypothetical protein